MNPRARLRAAIASGRLTAAPGIYDPLSARCARRAGFDTLYLGGNALGLHLGKGQPYVTLTETAEATRRIVANVPDVALIVDAGAGFGGPSHVHHAVREIEAAGAAALHMDDQPYPKSPDYHRGRGKLMPIDAVTAKLRVALETRHDPDMLLIGRTDALRVTGSMDEVVDRARAYADAHIDALLVLDLTPALAAQVQAAVPGMPLIWIGGVNPPVPDLQEIARADFRVALYPFNAVAAVSSALVDLWQGLARDGRITQSSELLARARGETLDLVDMARCWDMEDRSA